MLTWLLALIAAMSGALLSFLYEPESSLSKRVCGGTCTGLGLLGLVGFIYASFLGLSGLSVILTAITLGCSSLLLTSQLLRLRIAREFRNTARSFQQATAQR